MGITRLARRVARLLEERRVKVVFAESCTGGLVSGALTRVPGISAWHCGGVVVYRNETKTQYLGIPSDLLAGPGPVSSDVAAQLATSILNKTPEADISAAVTGHLGPNAPPEQDGLVFVAIARRNAASGPGSSHPVMVEQLHCREDDSRRARQKWVVAEVLRLLAEELEKGLGKRAANKSP